MTDLVFLDYTKRQLDDAYDQRVWARDSEHILGRQAETARRIRNALLYDEYRYGSAANEVLDVFRPDNETCDLPIVVFFHGGAWRSLSKLDFAAPATVVVKHDCIYVSVDFPLLPDATLEGMVESCRSALLWIAWNAHSFGGDPDQIFVGGHSSGAHLSASMLTTDWRTYGRGDDFLAGGIVISGMYDLYPVMLSKRNSYLNLTRNEARWLSPIRNLVFLTCPVIAVYGELESPEFLRQSRVFSEVLLGMGLLFKSIEIAGSNHFDVVDNLIDGGESLMALLGLIRDCKR